MQLSHIVIAAFCITLFYFWWKTMQAREYAQKLASIACTKENMQLLDGTVALKKFAYEKARNGRRYFLRYFSFEFSSNGDDRRTGIIALYGLHLYYSYLDLPKYPTIETDASPPEDSNMI